ncbi:hypothetical protein Tco_1430080 [Tanacetum coccineum]
MDSSSTPPPCLHPNSRRRRVLGTFLRALGAVVFSSLASMRDASVSPAQQPYSPSSVPLLCSPLDKNASEDSASTERAHALQASSYYKWIDSYPAATILNLYSTFSLLFNASAMPKQKPPSLAGSRTLIIQSSVSSAIRSFIVVIQDALRVDSQASSSFKRLDTVDMQPFHQECFANRKRRTIRTSGSAASTCDGRVSYARTLNYQRRNHVHMSAMLTPKFSQRKRAAPSPTLCRKDYSKSIASLAKTCKISKQEPNSQPE